MENNLTSKELSGTENFCTQNSDIEAFHNIYDTSTSPGIFGTRMPYGTIKASAELSAPLPYVKFLPEPTEELRYNLKHASGKIKYGGTNNYIFQAFLQENNDALKSLICSVLHMDPETIISIEITNPILLGKYIEGKTFILDIKVLLNNNIIINLEMQIENQQNWPERSLGYLCRSFDNLNSGEEYIDTKSAIHIGFLDFHLFPNSPEFHATYKLLNIKNFHEYTDKFVLHMVDLKCIHLATKEDKAHEMDKWASFFKAKTWEELIMLANQMPTLQSSVETLYQLNTDEQIRETCDRFIRAESRERGYKNYIAKLTEEVAEKDAEIAKQEKENEYLKSLLAEHGIHIE